MAKSRKVVGKGESIVPIRLEWDLSKLSESIYANQLLVTHAGTEFYLVFGEVEPLVALRTEDLPRKLKVIPVAKIAITHENMLRFVEAINSNMDRFKARKDAETIRGEHSTSDREREGMGK